MARFRQVFQMNQAVLIMISNLISALFTLPWWVYPAMIALFFFGRRATSGPLTRRAHWPPGSSVTAETAPEGAARMLVRQLESDLIARKLVSLIARTTRLAPTVRAAKARYDERAALVSHVERRLEGCQRQAADDPEPVLTARAASIIWTLLIAGDLTVVSQTIVGLYATISPMMAMILALAVTIAVVLAGKYLGHALRGARLSSRWALVVGAIVLVAFSVSLSLLRGGHSLAWLGLNMAPAIGAALLVVLGPSAAQWRVHRFDRSVRRDHRRLGRIRRRWARLEGRFLALWARIDALVAKGMLTVQAEADRTGVEYQPVNWHQLALRTGLPVLTQAGLETEAVGSDSERDDSDDESELDEALYSLWGPRDSDADLDLYGVAAARSDIDQDKPRSSDDQCPGSPDSHEPLAGPAYYVNERHLNGEQP